VFLNRAADLSKHFPVFAKNDFWKGLIFSIGIEMGLSTIAIFVGKIERWAWKSRAFLPASGQIFPTLWRRARRRDRFARELPGGIALRKIGRRWKVLRHIAKQPSFSSHCISKLFLVAAIGICAGGVLGCASGNAASMSLDYYVYI